MKYAAILVSIAVFFTIGVEVIGLLYRNSRRKQGLPFLHATTFGFVRAMAFWVWMLLVCSLAGGNSGILASLMLSLMLLHAAWLRADGGWHVQIANIFQELSEGARQRLPLDDILSALSSEMWDENKLRLVAASERVRAGMRLSTALEMSGVVPAYAIAMLRAGEAGGGAGMAEVLASIGRDLRAEAQSRSAVRGAMSYPLAVWACCLPLVFGVVVYFFPRFGIEGIPIRTSRWNWATLFWSPIPSWAPYFKLGLILVLFVSILGLLAALLQIQHAATGGRTLAMYFSISRWRQRLEDTVFALLPVLRGRFYNRSLARCCRVIAGMVETNLSLPEVCRVVATIAGPYRKAFLRLGSASSTGVPLPDALRASGLPESFTNLALAGAASGEFGAAMRVAAEWHESRARRANSLLAAAVPVVMLPLAGLLVGSVYIGVFALLSEVVDALRHSGGFF